jgi:hypothetical protein
MSEGSRMLKVIVAAPDGDFFGMAKWNEEAVERFRDLVGDEVALKMLRDFARDLSQSVEDVIARRRHPKGRCLPGCSHHGYAPHRGRVHELPDLRGDVP